jgi:integrase
MARKHKTGSVEEYAPGKHRVRTRIDGKLATVNSGMTKASAERYADAISAYRAEQSQLTFAALIEMARLERQRRKGKSLKTSTIRQEQSTLSLLAKSLGHIRVAEMQTRDIREYLKTVDSVSTQRNRLNLIRYALQMAVDDDVISVNIADSVKLKRESGRLKKSELLAELIWPFQQQALIDKLTEPGRFTLSTDKPSLDLLRRQLLLAACLFALGTGCRLSEQWGVKRVDVSEDRILISRSVANEAPKSGDWREVPILPPTAAALRILERVREAHPAIAKSEWLFPGERGDQRKWSAAPRGWSELLKAAKVGHRNWHWLRHTCATSLLCGWWGEPWTLEQVKAILGHSSVTTTEIYAQLLDDAAFKAAEKSFQIRSRKREVGNVEFSAV